MPSAAQKMGITRLRHSGMVALFLNNQKVANLATMGAEEDQAMAD